MQGWPAHVVGHSFLFDKEDGMLHDFKKHFGSRNLSAPRVISYRQLFNTNRFHQIGFSVHFLKNKEIPPILAIFRQLPSFLSVQFQWPNLEHEQ